MTSWLMPMWEPLWAFPFGETKPSCMKSGDLVFPKVDLYTSAILDEYSYIHTEH